MNLSRAFAGFVSSSRKWDVLRSSAALRSLLLSTELVSIAPRKSYKTSAKASEAAPPDEPPTPKDPSELPRPSEIPYQAKVANSIHLVGTIGAEVKLQPLPDGNYASLTVLVHENKDKSPSFPGLDEGFKQFWIPIIFHGDLAQIAACHLRENDIVYLCGQLIGDSPSSSIKDSKANIKLFAHSLNFVKEGTSGNISQFVHKRQELSTVDSGGFMKLYNPVKSLWDELVVNPNNWFDNREAKLKGLINPRSPDFKHIDSGQGLWLDSAPESVVPKLEGLVFGGSGNLKNLKKLSFSSAKNSEKDDLWKSLVENPKVWWDNRLNKLKPNSPDFKHKDDGDALWLSSAPSWVLPKLPPLSTEKKSQ